jgi:hypothetical protein
MNPISFLAFRGIRILLVDLSGSHAVTSHLSRIVDSLTLEGG